MKSIKVIIFLLCIACNAWSANYSFLPSKGLTYKWTSDDVIAITAGIMTDGTTELRGFYASSMSSSSPNDKAFYATGFSLKDGMKYYSFFPYSRPKDFTAEDVTFSYSGQKQAGNDDTRHVGKYDFAMASATPTNGVCRFDFSRLGCVLRLVIKMSEARVVSSVGIRTEGKKIPTMVHANLKKCGEKDALSYDGFDESISIGFDNQIVEAGETLVAYIVFPGTDLSGEALSIVVATEKGTETIAMMRGENFVAGKVYEIETEKLVKRESALKTEAQKAKSFDFTDGEGKTITTASSVSYPVAHLDDIMMVSDFNPQAIPMILRGDVNDDGKVDTTDAELLNKLYLADDTAKLNLRVCDLNDDGVIDIQDVVTIISLSNKQE